MRANAVMLLREYGVQAIFRENSNAPDVRYATIQRLGAHMLRRTASGEQAFRISDDPGHWVIVSADGPQEGQFFLADGCEAGYVWDPIAVSVGSKKVNRPRKDGWYEHAQNNLEYLELNFGADRPTREAEDRRAKVHLFPYWPPPPSGPPGWMAS